MQTITVEALKEILDAGEKINLVDVREPHEHEEFNIGGTLYPLGRILSMDVDELESLKDQEVIFYCRSGNRSGSACDMMSAQGFKAYNLAGGVGAWPK